MNPLGPAGLGTYNNDTLALFSSGGTLYGIDSLADSSSGHMDIYTISISTGDGRLQLRSVTVSGLSGLDSNPNAYTFDTGVSLTSSFSPAAVPEPSSLILCGVAGVVGLTISRAVRRRLAA